MKRLLPRGTVTLDHLKAHCIVTDRGCWEWQRGRDTSGYGQVTADLGRERVHRVTFRLAGHEIPNGAMVLHTCDNPPCINPGHLYAGTNTDNMRDRRQRGRENLPVGENHFRTKLTLHDVETIRQDPRRQRDIAADYGVTQAAISSIKLGRTWKHVS